MIHEKEEKLLYSKEKRKEKRRKRCNKISLVIMTGHSVGATMMQHGKIPLQLKIFNRLVTVKIKNL